MATVPSPGSRLSWPTVRTAGCRTRRPRVNSFRVVRITQSQCRVRWTSSWLCRGAGTRSRSSTPGVRDDHDHRAPRLPQAGAGNRPEEPCRGSAQDQQASACRPIRQYPRGQAVSQFRGHPALRKHPGGTDGSPGKPDGVSVAKSRGRRLRIRRPAGDGGVAGQHQVQLGAAQPSLPRRPVHGSIGRRRTVHACHDPRPALAAYRNPVLLARHLVSFRLPRRSARFHSSKLAPSPPCRQGRRSLSSVVR